MANFDEAIETVLKHEGGFVNDKVDPGGATKYGISLTYLEKEEYVNEIMDEIDFNKNNYIDAEDIKHLPLDIAKRIYKMCWWEKYKYENIYDQKLATTVFDIAVNIGPYRSHLFLQKAINEINEKHKLKEDGIIGINTITVSNSMCPKKLVYAYKRKIEGFYKDKCRQHPARLKYLKGWLNRLYG